MKYFVTSDIHSFFSAFKQALDEAGFDKKNKEHILIVDGDLLDRGEETLKTIKFIKSIPKSRRILIRGNHEYLFRDLVRRGKALEHDYANCTLKSLLNLNKEESIFTFDYCITTKVTSDYVK
jgi:predicted phosphohydrolase